MSNNKGKSSISWPTFGFSGGFLLLFLIISLINDKLVGKWINASFNFSVRYFGAYWEVLLLGTFLVSIFLMCSPYGKARLGKMDKPEFGFFRWISMILCTLLASGGVFWAAAEPMYHFITHPPLFNHDGFSKKESVLPALAYSYLHWGFLAWAILGSLTTIILMYVHYHKGYPLKPRSILYPIFGEKIFKKSVLGSIADITSIVAVAAGTIGPIGFLGTQVGYGLHALFNIPDNLTTQTFIIIFLVVISSISAATGIDRGIQWLSRINIGLAVLLMAFMLILGPTMFIINQFVASEGFYIQNFFTMTTYQTDQSWLGYWTVFFWGWFLGYGPMMAIFISKITRGRTIRQLILGVSVIAPLVSNFWFTVVGGSGIYYELKNPGSVSTALNKSGMPATVMAIMHQIPLGYLLSIGFLIVTIVFVATTADSMAYTVAISVQGGEGEPSKLSRVFWAIMFGVIAVVLLYIGSGSITLLQNFIVVTAVPVSILLLPTIWLAPKIAVKLEKEQQLTIQQQRNIS